MRYLLDYQQNLKAVSFGADLTCDGQNCQEYAGAVPTGYESLEAWYLAESEKLYRWQVIDGQLTLNSSTAEPACVGNYVEEFGQNDDGTWHWRKWANGWAECWGYITPDLSLEQMANGLYYCSGEEEFPVSFVDYWPTVSGSCPIQAGPNWVNVGPSISSPHTFDWQFFTTSETLDGSALPIFITAAGRWKY